MPTITREQMLREGDSGKLWPLHFAACMNAKYHQIVAETFRRRDRIVRLAVGLFAMACVIASSFQRSNAEMQIATVVTSVLSLIAAFVLNVVGFGDQYVLHRELLRRWLDLRRDIEILELDVQQLDEGPVKESCIERYESIVNRKTLIAQDEPAPDEELLMKCYEDENERRHGSGIRKFEQVAELREKKQSKLVEFIANRD
jgi:hypothetical protein